MAAIQWQYDTACIILVDFEKIHRSGDGLSHVKEHLKSYRLVYNLCIYLVSSERSESALAHGVIRVDNVTCKIGGRVK